MVQSTDGVAPDDKRAETIACEEVATDAAAGKSGSLNALGGSIFCPSSCFEECQTVQDMLEVACRLLAVHLQAERVDILQIDPEAGDCSATAHQAILTADTEGAAKDWSSLRTVTATLRPGESLRVFPVGARRGSEAHDLVGPVISADLAVAWRGACETSAVIVVRRSAAPAWSDEDVTCVRHFLAHAMEAVISETALRRERAIKKEIDHRTRNMLAVSRALIRKIDADGVEAFRECAMDRIGALASTLGALSQSDWTGITFETIVETEIAPFASKDHRRIELAGPSTILPACMAQPVTMAIHELATNAVKYGALSSPEGELRVSWTLRPDGMFEVHWQETTSRTAEQVDLDDCGFGTELLELTIEDQLEGKIRRTLNGPHFTCTLEFPLGPRV